MKDIYDIVRHVAMDPRGPWALATLVRTRGSSYRRPGARMLVRQNGPAIGSLSGGCLEDEVAAEAREVMATGIPKLIRFDTRKRFGCNGEIEIFVESIGEEFFAEVAARLERRQICGIATVFGTEPFRSELVEVGAVHQTASGRLGQSPLPEILLQKIQPPIRLIIVGDGPDSAPIREIARGLGWITLEIPSIHQLEVRPDFYTAAVIKTHNYGKDFAAMQHLLPLNLRYVGLIGPRRRRDQLLHDLLDVGVSINAGFFAPAGLDLHSETPSEIALAIVSEIQRAFSGGTGASLRERKVPIHATAKVTSRDLIDSTHSAAIIPD